MSRQQTQDDNSPGNTGAGFLQVLTQLAISESQQPGGTICYWKDKVPRPRPDDLSTSRHKRCRSLGREVTETLQRSQSKNNPCIASDQSELQLPSTR